MLPLPGVSHHREALPVLQGLTSASPAPSCLLLPPSSLLRAYQWFSPSVPFSSALPCRLTSLRYPVRKSQYYPILKSDHIDKLQKNKRRKEKVQGYPPIYLPPPLPRPSVEGMLLTGNRRCRLPPGFDNHLG